MAEAKMTGRERAIARLRRIGSAMEREMAPAFEAEVEDLVQAQKRAAPVNPDIEDTPGTFRDSIHKYPTPGRDLSFRIIADAKDDKGNFIGPHIEHGHTAPDGSWVPPTPSFFPTYRARKKKMRARLSRLATKIAKRNFGAT
jgi:hypothetical protein